jgi:uncharacterized membrane protein
MSDPMIEPPDGAGENSLDESLEEVLAELLDDGLDGLEPQLDDDITDELSVTDLIEEAYDIGTTDSLAEAAELPLEEQLAVDPLLASDETRLAESDVDEFSIPGDPIDPDQTGAAITRGDEGSWRDALPGGESAEDLVVMDILEAELLAEGHLDAENMAQEALGEALIEAGALDENDLSDDAIDPASHAPPHDADSTIVNVESTPTDQGRTSPMSDPTSEHGPGRAGATDPMTTGMITGGDETAERAAAAAEEAATTSSGMMHSLVATIEQQDVLDSIGERLDPLAESLDQGPAGLLLRGEWLGHALHPLLTDFPLGCWISAGLLDLVGGRHTRKAAERLVGLGLLASIPTAAAGMVEWRRLDDDSTRRIGTAHGVGNMAVALIYFKSWRSRRKGRQIRGVLWGLAGASVAWGTGYLGGHLSMARGVGTGMRGAPGEPLDRKGGERMGPTPEATLVDEHMVSSSPR